MLPIPIYPPIRFTHPILSPSSWLFIDQKDSINISKYLCDKIDVLRHFDAKDVHSIKVLRDNHGMYWLFYNGPPRRLAKGFFKLRNGIGLALSKDGVFFVRSPQNPILKPSFYGWDSGYLWKCSPLKVGSKFILYYGAYSRSGESGIGLAFSSNGFSWIKYKNPILVPEAEKGEKSIGSPAVMYDKDRGLFIMLYLIKPLNSIGLAYSINGIKWKKFERNPVLSPLPRSFEEYFISPFCITKIGKIYALFYEGKSETKKDNWRIGLAYSDNLVTWSRCSRNPILEPGPQGNFDDLFVSDPSVVFERNVLRMYYGCKNVSHVGYGGLAFFPLQPEFEDYFRIKGVEVNVKEVEANIQTDGIIYKGWRALSVFINSYSLGSITIQTLCNKSWRDYDEIPLYPGKIIDYTVSSEGDIISGVRLKFNSNVKLTAKWTIKEPCYWI